MEILLVDDNPADVDLILSVLTQMPTPHHSSTACDGEDALAFMRRQGKHRNAPRPDLISLDLNLPRKDGRAVLAELKSDPEFRRIPIVIFSTSQAGRDILSSYELGANSYVSKPGNLKDFASVVLATADFWFRRAHLPPREQR